MTTCPGTMFTNCTHPELKPGENLCPNCIKELRQYREDLMGISELKNNFLGKSVDIAKIEKAGWFGINSPKFPLGFPKVDHSWLKELPSQEYMGYLQVILGATGTITDLNILTFGVGADGGMDLSLVNIDAQTKESISSSFKEITSA